MTGERYSFFPRDAELGHIGNPLLIRGIRVELAFQQIRRNNALLALVRVVALFPPDLADQPQRIHQLKHSLLRDLPALLGQLGLDAAVPVPGAALLENLCNSGLQGGPRIGALEAGLVVEERGPG